jgi:hypothetical protein
LKLALEALSFAIPFVGSHDGDVAGRGTGQHLEGVPVAVGHLESPLSAVPKVLPSEETGIEPPNGRTVKDGRRHCDLQDFVVRQGTRGRKGSLKNFGRKGAGSEVGRTKNMVQPRSVLPVSMVKGEVTTSGSLKSRIEVVHQGRGQLDPVIRKSARRFPVNGARTTVPITSPKGHAGRVKKSGMVDKRPKKGRPF